MFLRSGKYSKRHDLRQPTHLGENNILVTLTNGVVVSDEAGTRQRLPCEGLWILRDELWIIAWKSWDPFKVWKSASDTIKMAF